MAAKDVSCAGSCRNGICVHGTCVCASGWNGHGDFLTGDLTAWGGPLLDCTNHLLTLRVLWCLVLLFCTVALTVAPFALYQQWQKYVEFREQGAMRHWYYHRPLLFVAGHAIIVLDICSMAVAKIVTLEKVVGIDVHISIGTLIMSTFGFPLTAAFFFEVIKTFGRNIRGDMHPSRRWKRALRIAELIFLLATITIACTGFYPIVYLTASPLSGRNVHVICSRLVMLQTALTALLSTIVMTLFTFEIVHNINVTLRERTVLANWTRLRELHDSVASLRRTRLKVCSWLIGSIISMTLTWVFNLWLISSNTARQRYSSYLFVLCCLSYAQSILLVLHTYTAFDVPSRTRLMRALGLRRFLGPDVELPPNPIGEADQSHPQGLDSAAAVAQTVANAAVVITLGHDSTICQEGRNDGVLEPSLNPCSVQDQEELPLPQQPRQRQHLQQPTQQPTSPSHPSRHPLPPSQQQQQPQRPHASLEGEQVGEQRRNTEQQPEYDC